MIYVKQRIAHHLDFAAFSVMNVARFALLVLIWQCLFQDAPRRFTSLSEPLRKIYLFGLGSLLISLAGLLLSGVAASGGSNAQPAAELLRFYWFRFSDFAIPATLSLLIAQYLSDWLVRGKHLGRKICAGVALTALAIAFALFAYQVQLDPRPVADQKNTLAGQAGSPDSLQTWQHWRDVCDWIAQKTPVNAAFITPLGQSSFKWYAHRQEIVNWKDIPQDAESIVEWNHRVQALLEPQKLYEAGLMAYSDDQLIEMGRRYQADYLLLPAWQINKASAPTKLPRVYPVESDTNSEFWIFDLKPPA